MLKLKNIKKQFGDFTVLDGIDLELKKGEVAAIIGPSGTGKSTLLRCINLLETPTEGTIEIDGFSVDSKNLSPKDCIELRKKTAMVFQNYSLFKNKTVLENIMMPMTLVQKKDKKVAEEEAMALLKKVGLADKRDYYPSRLSGGQQQRIGIARALAVHPEIILFDEPTSSLDPELVNEVLELIRELSNEHECTMLIVTHEMRFALEIADKIIFMEKGRVVEEGSPNELLYNSKNERTRSYFKQFIDN